MLSVIFEKKFRKKKCFFGFFKKLIAFYEVNNMNKTGRIFSKLTSFFLLCQKGQKPTPEGIAVHNQVLHDLEMCMGPKISQNQKLCFLFLKTSTTLHTKRWYLINATDQKDRYHRNSSDQRKVKTLWILAWIHKIRTKNNYTLACTSDATQNVQIKVISLNKNKQIILFLIFDFSLFSWNQYQTNDLYGAKYICSSGFPIK